MTFWGWVGVIAVTALVVVLFFEIGTFIWNDLRKRENLYAHFKGEEYEVLEHSAPFASGAYDGCSSFVVYRSVKTGQIFVRTPDDFNGKIHWNDDGTYRCRRFEPVKKG